MKTKLLLLFIILFMICSNAFALGGEEYNYTSKYQKMINVNKNVYNSRYSEYQTYFNTKDNLEHIYNPTWIKDSVLKWGLVGSLAFGQFCTGVTESYKFGGRTLASAGNYHTWRYGQDIGFLGFGYMAYANITSPDPKLPWWRKATRITGSVLIGRNFYEMAYRWNKCGGPFKTNAWSEENPQEYAIVYLTISKEGIKDVGISGYGRQLIIYDIVFWIAGVTLISI